MSRIDSIIIVIAVGGLVLPIVGMVIGEYLDERDRQKRQRDWDW